MYLQLCIFLILVLLSNLNISKEENEKNGQEFSEGDGGLPKSPLKVNEVQHIGWKGCLGKHGIKHYQVGRHILDGIKK